MNLHGVLLVNRHKYDYIFRKSRKGVRAVWLILIFIAMFFGIALVLTGRI